MRGRRHTVRGRARALIVYSEREGRIWQICEGVGCGSHPLAWHRLASVGTLRGPVARLWCVLAVSGRIWSRQIAGCGRSVFVFCCGVLWCWSSLFCVLRFDSGSVKCWIFGRVLCWCFVACRRCFVFFVGIFRGLVCVC